MTAVLKIKLLLLKMNTLQKIGIFLKDVMTDS